MIFFEKDIYTWNNDGLNLRQKVLKISLVAIPMGSMGDDAADFRQRFTTRYDGYRNVTQPQTLESPKIQKQRTELPLG